MRHHVGTTPCNDRQRMHWASAANGTGHQTHPGIRPRPVVSRNSRSTSGYISTDCGKGADANRRHQHQRQRYRRHRQPERPPPVASSSIAISANDRHGADPYPAKHHQPGGATALCIPDTAFTSLSAVLAFLANRVASRRRVIGSCTRTSRPMRRDKRIATLRTNDIREAASLRSCQVALMHDHSASSSSLRRCTSYSQVPA